MTDWTHPPAGIAPATWAKLCALAIGAPPFDGICVAASIAHSCFAMHEVGRWTLPEAIAQLALHQAQVIGELQKQLEDMHARMPIAIVRAPEPDR